MTNQEHFTSLMDRADAKLATGNLIAAKRLAELAGMFITKKSPQSSHIRLGRFMSQHESLQEVRRRQNANNRLKRGIWL